MIIKNILVAKFQDLGSKKLRNMLGILDDLFILFRTQEITRIVDNFKLMSEDSFQLIEEKSW